MLAQLFLFCLFTKSVLSNDILYDFTSPDTSIDSFYEVSDTVRSVGMSKSDMCIIQSEAIQYAAIFFLLNPQPDGACFAGMKTTYTPTLDWSNYQSVEIRLRGQGMYNAFKLVLQDSKSDMNSSLAFENQFHLDTSTYPSFLTISLPLTEFPCYYRGEACSQSMDLADVMSLGFQAAGGVYDTELSQQGVASLEIEYIALN